MYLTINFEINKSCYYDDNNYNNNNNNKNRCYK